MRKRSEADIEQLMHGYQESGLSRGEYCLRVGIPLSTFDYYRQRASRKAAAKTRAAAKLVRVSVEPAPAEAPKCFTLVLGNGRRIESAWHFADAELARLIRIAETA